jgi:hypothetical protein
MNLQTIKILQLYFFLLPFNQASSSPFSSHTTMTLKSISGHKIFISLLASLAFFSFNAIACEESVMKLQQVLAL